MKSRNNLSQVNCNTTFKSILRTGSEDRKDILIAPVTDVNKAKFAMRKETRSMDNLDQFINEKDKLKNKYEKLYGKEYSAFRTTLTDKYDNKRTGSLRRDQIESYDKQNVPTIRQVHEAKMKEFYHANPIETFNKQRIHENIIEERNRNRVRCEKVSDYLGSTGVKSIFNTDNNVLRNRTSSDKITCKNEALASRVNKEAKAHEYKKFNHYFEGKIGCFMK